MATAGLATFGSRNRRRGANHGHMAMAMACEICNLVRLEPRKGTLKCNGRPDLVYLVLLCLASRELGGFDHINIFDDFFKICSAQLLCASRAISSMERI